MVVGREAEFGDPEFVKLLSRRFVPVSVNSYKMFFAQTDDGEFLRKVFDGAMNRAGLTRVGKQKFRNEKGEEVVHDNQGNFTCDVQGNLLGGQKGRWAGSSVQSATAALNDFEKRKGQLADQKVSLPPADQDTMTYGPQPPDGGLVVEQTIKVIGGHQDRNSMDAGLQGRAGYYAKSLGLDRLWIRRDEAELLAQGKLPESLTNRIVLYHLRDNTCGQLWHFWSAKDVKKSEIRLEEGRLTGKVHLEKKKHGYEAELLGFVEARGGRVTRFDVVVKGWSWDNEVWSHAPPGSKQLLAITFRLSDPGNKMGRVPPGALRHFSEYLR